MKTWKRALALVLALVMALSLVALPSFAEGEDDTGTGDGMPRVEDAGGEKGTDLVMSKKVEKTGDAQFLLTLEAYATGSKSTSEVIKPVDIVLVLDVSGSMTETPYIDSYSPVYSVDSDGTYYYQDANGQYQQAYYCDGEYGVWGSHHDAGWYTQDHQSWGSCQGESGRRLTPKTSASDTDTSHTQFYTRSQSTKLDALKSAVNDFIDTVADKYKDYTDPEQKANIAIVKFAGNTTTDDIGNVIKKESHTGNNDSKCNVTQPVTAMLPVTETNAATLKDAVKGLSAAGETRSDYGMARAKTILDSRANNGNAKLVIMFTDGSPSTFSDFSETVANSAITTSKALKNAGATVYTIGCFGGSTDPDVDSYMNRVSSNHPDATSYNDKSTKKFNDYYMTVSSSSSLGDIFKAISQTTGGTTVSLGSETVLRDVISSSFTLPEGYKDGDIQAYSVECMGSDASGYTWSDTHAETFTPTVAADRKTVDVKGFNYSANWVDQHGVGGSTSHGQKLVVKIPIVPDKEATGLVDTNGAASGIYVNGTADVPFATFPIPTVYIPYFTVTHVASTVDSATGANKGVVGASENYPLWCYKEFNLTSVVTRNYLYGGTFNEDTCINVHNDVQEQGNPMKLNPTENATYYIWEVPDTYLRPFGYWISRHLEGGQGTLSVTQLYLLAAVDRVNYADAGLKVSFGNGTSQYISSSCEELSNPNTEQLGSATVYQMLETVKGHAGGEVIDTWYLKNGIPVNYEGPLTKSEETGKYLDANDKNNSPIDDGCIIGHRLKGKEFESFQKSGVTYRPYWVTLDGVRVEGVRSRNYTFVVGSADPGKPSKDDQLPAVYQYLEKQQSAQTLTLRTNLLAGDTEPAVNDLTVTVIDGSNAPQTIKVAPNGSVRDQVAYQAPAGKVFAGWFTDDSFTTPADLDQVTQDTTIYAKYVSDSYLDLAYSRTGLFRLRGVTLISAVDNPANYQVSGFIVGDQKVDVSYASRYRIFKTPANLFGAARDAKLMLADKSLSGAGDLEVTPYWVTLDGTEVHGVTHTLHYNTRTIWE